MDLTVLTVGDLEIINGFIRRRCVHHARPSVSSEVCCVIPAHFGSVRAEQFRVYILHPTRAFGSRITQLLYQEPLIITEIRRTPDRVQAARPTGSARRLRRDGKQRREKRGGLTTKLRLTQHRGVLAPPHKPSYRLFLCICTTQT